jgi:hypothetical protein
MSYSQGGLIEAADYNTILGSNTSVDATTLHAVWAWGSNSRGYGQSTLSTVSTSSIVTATQWATLINTINSANLHINNTTSGLTANTAGQVIGFSGGLPLAISRLNQDRLLFGSNSAVVVNASSLTAYAAWTNTSTSATLSRAFGARVSWNLGADAARFFFNAGGRLKFNVSATTTGGAGSRSQAAKAVVDNLGGIALFAANTNAGRTGAGGTVGTNDTTKGYYTSPFNANTTVVAITSTTTSYTSDTGSIAVKPGGSQGSFNGNGDNVEFWTTINSTSGGNAGGSFDDSLDLTVTVTVDVSFPEVSNLSNTWGAVTVTRL